jgi:restriction system protein
MVIQEKTIWGIHAGKTGDADSLFLKKKKVAIGWAKCGDLGSLPPDREAYKELVAKTFPEAKPGAIPTNAGQLYRFVHEMKPDDLVVYSSKRDRSVHIGRITGQYRYDPNLEPGYPNLHDVEWLKTIPRTHFTQGALYEIGSAMSLFQVKNYADEFLAALHGKPSVETVGEDATVALVAEEIEQTTSDFILKQLSKELKGHPLAEFVAHLLQKMGYRIRLSPEGPDGGIDIIAHKDELGFEPPIIKVQVKSKDGNVGDPDTSALYGKVGAGEFGLLVTLGSFTKQAQSFARSKTNLRLIDGPELVTLILQHYEELDSRYKGLLPLKRVYVPEALEESED